jgi:hypothetical protein
MSQPADDNAHVPTQTWTPGFNPYLYYACPTCDGVGYVDGQLWFCFCFPYGTFPKPCPECGGLSQEDSFL